MLGLFKQRHQWLLGRTVTRPAVGWFQIRQFPGSLAPPPGEKLVPYCAKCAEEWRTSYLVILVGPIRSAPTSADVSTALAGLDTATLPHEPKGADLTRQAQERPKEGYDDLDRWYPDDSDDWKRGQQ